MTGKGDRWEGDRQVGRSEPAFGVASTTALPPPTCTARREAGQRRLRLLFCCEAGQLLAVVSSRPVPVGLSAGCVRMQRPCSAGYVCLLAFAMPCPLPSSFAPVHFASPTPLFIPCAPGSSQGISLQAARTVPLAATTRVCSGGPRAALHPPPIHCAARTAL